MQGRAWKESLCVLHMDNQTEKQDESSMAGRAWVKQHLLIPRLFPVPEPAPDWATPAPLAGRLGTDTRMGFALCWRLTVLWAWGSSSSLPS